MTDSFGNPVFKESFKKFFEIDENGDLKMGFLATTKVLTGLDFKVSGAIGQCAPVSGQGSQYVSSETIGIGGTNTWYIGGIDQNKSLAIYFDITSTQTLTAQKKVHLQF
jgi:protein transport protein SEC23